MNNDFTEPTSFHSMNREMRKERSQQQRLTTRHLSGGQRDELDHFWSMTLQRTKAGGQTLMVAIFHCGAGEPIARWWVISRQLVFADGSLMYGVDTEAAAVAEVKNRL